MSGADTELEFGGGGASDLFNWLFHVRSFTTLLFAVGNVTIFEGPCPTTRSAPGKCTFLRDVMFTVIYVSSSLRTVLTRGTQK